MELQDGLHLGAHGAGREVPFRHVSLQLCQGSFAQLLLEWFSPIDRHPGHIRGDDEDVGPDLTGEHRTGEILVDDGIHPPEFALFADHRDAPAAAADDDELHFDQLFDLAVLDDRKRRGARHHAPEALVRLDHGVRQTSGLLLGVEGADGLGGVPKRRVFLVDHDIGDQRDEQLLRGDPHLHQGPVEAGFDHIADLPLGHGDNDLERHVGHLTAALLLQEQVARLRAVAVSDHDAVIARQTGNLAHGHLQVGELLLGRSLLAFLDQGVAA